jgi:hypothetical protein
LRYVVILLRSALFCPYCCHTAARSLEDRGRSIVVEENFFGFFEVLIEVPHIFVVILVAKGVTLVPQLQ